MWALLCQLLIFDNEKLNIWPWLFSPEKCSVIDSKWEKKVPHGLGKVLFHCCLLEIIFSKSNFQWSSTSSGIWNNKWEYRKQPDVFDIPPSLQLILWQLECMYWCPPCILSLYWMKAIIVSGVLEVRNA